MSAVIIRFLLHMCVTACSKDEFSIKAGIYIIWDLLEQLYDLQMTFLSPSCDPSVAGCECLVGDSRGLLGKIKGPLLMFGGPLHQ